MSEPALKCENNEAIFKQNYTLELFIALKMAYSCCFGLRGNLDFPDFHRSSSWCYKTFFGGNLDFPKIKKLNKVCSNVWTCTKMWKAKLYSKSVYFF